MPKQNSDYRLQIDGTRVGKIPKVSLHDHLDGGLRAETIIELAPAAGYKLPETDPDALRTWFTSQADSGSLERYLTTFGTTLAVMQSAPNLVRVAREFVEDLAADGVVYGEIRWAPEQHLAAGLSLDDAVAAVQSGLDEGQDAAERSGHKIRVGQLLSGMRNLNRTAEIADLAIRQRGRAQVGPGVVGFDIAGPENGFLPATHRAAFDKLAAAYMPVTVHAGESGDLASIKSALFDGRALRLGHGARIALDITVKKSEDDSHLVSLGEVAQWVRDREIALELSPSSNLQTGAIKEWGSDLADHPFDMLYQLGFRVTVNTDNRLQSGTTLSREIYLLADAFGYDRDDLLGFQLNAAAATFLPLEDREALAERIEEGFGLV